jgi:hypothetical protein
MTNSETPERITREDLALEFNYDDGDNVVVTVSGHTKDVTALRALIEVGDEENLELLRESIDNGEVAEDADIEVEYTFGDDHCTVTASGFTNIRRGVEALEQAGSEEIFLNLVDAFTAEGDGSLDELYDEDEDEDDEDDEDEDEEEDDEDDEPADAADADDADAAEGADSVAREGAASDDESSKK